MRYLVLLLLGFLGLSVSSRVIELSDRFLEIKKDGHWLVMFYAPWCAHCKRLEPVWLHVAQALFDSNIRVGRIDCTRYTSMTHRFGISGFPTIMFLKGEEKEVEFKGERTKDEIVKFAQRLTGPPVQPITKVESLPLLQQTHTVFFLYVGQHLGPLWETFFSVAQDYQPHAFFYSVFDSVFKKHQQLTEAPSIHVFKEKLYYQFKPDQKEALNSSLIKWVNEERFNTFVKITKGNIHQFLQTNKYLVLAVIAESVPEEIPEDMMVFRDIVESVIISNRDKYHKRFQFGWVGQPELANSIAMTELELPHLLVVNSTTQHHHLADWQSSDKVSHDDIVAFLDSILDDSAPKYGGNGFLVRGYRMYYDSRTALAQMWKGNPVLTSVLFGLPLGFLSLILYSTCCKDILDANTDDEDEAGFSHEKKE